MNRTVAGSIVLLLTCSVPALAGDRVVARVGSEAVTLRELNTAQAQNQQLTREKALELLIERRLVLVWAKSRNITVREQEVEQAEASIRERNNLSPEDFETALIQSGETLQSFREGLREQITINKALSMALSAQMETSEEELLRAYERDYTRTTIFEVSHILWTLGKDAPSDKEALVRQKAAEVLTEIENGASFESMALKHSQDSSSADNGGKLGRFKEGELFPELEKLAVSLEPGETGGPVKTSAGYHLLKLLSKEIIEPPPLAEVRGSLERNILNQKEESVRNAWLDEIKEATYIEVFPDGG